MFEPLPKGPFDIIYADPPWEYRMKMMSGSKVSNHYPTIPTDILMTLDVQSISADDSILFMWATAPCLTDALATGEAWGFKYITIAFVWDKRVTTPGMYSQAQCEFVLLFKRGKIPQPRGDRAIKQFLSEKKTRHSAKPDEIRYRITKMFPTQRKIELFARNEYEGWTSYGNEV